MELSANPKIPKYYDSDSSDCCSPDAPNKPALRKKLMTKKRSADTRALKMKMIQERSGRSEMSLPVCKPKETTKDSKENKPETSASKSAKAPSLNDCIVPVPESEVLPCEQILPRRSSRSRKQPAVKPSTVRESKRKAQNKGSVPDKKIRLTCPTASVSAIQTTEENDVPLSEEDHQICKLETSSESNSTLDDLQDIIPSEGCEQDQPQDYSLISLDESPKEENQGEEALEIVDDASVPVHDDVLDDNAPAICQSNLQHDEPVKKKEAKVALGAVESSSAPPHNGLQDANTSEVRESNQLQDKRLDYLEESGPQAMHAPKTEYKIEGLDTRDGLSHLIGTSILDAIFPSKNHEVHNASFIAVNAHVKPDKGTIFPSTSAAMKSVLVEAAPAATKPTVRSVGVQWSLDDLDIPELELTSIPEGLLIPVSVEDEEKLQFESRIKELIKWLESDINVPVPNFFNTINKKPDKGTILPITSAAIKCVLVEAAPAATKPTVRSVGDQWSLDDLDIPELKLTSIPDDLLIPVPVEDEEKLRFESGIKELIRWLKSDINVPVPNFFNTNACTQARPQHSQNTLANQNFVA